MAAQDRRRVRQVFTEIIDLPEAQREAALVRACAGDAILRAEVEALLAAERDAGGFMASAEGAAVPFQSPTDTPTLAADTLAAPLREAPGTRIGPYKLLQQIGEGGFGVVFLAEQEKPVARRVALKVIKLGMDSRAVIARFEAERQALAMMDHPNIARVFDAGATETGRPYFVMELVNGVPITDYCDAAHLPASERLALFTAVCHAAQHAHQKGIIHRDIKPSNILVTLQDGAPVPKVIDFGIAKATSARLTEKTLFTEHRAMIGTPAYMSPEQAGMSNLDIDTRTDVYSLGVLLYELLTGTTPFSSNELMRAGYGEIQRIIREVDPPKPSTRISSLGPAIDSIAAHRRTDPRKLGSIMRGDLDWIVMKCLEKDRTRRYETANGLALDVQRHLAGEPVAAAPPSAAYRVRKFVRRKKGLVAAASLVFTALVLGLAGTLWQAAVAANQRDVALNAATRADKNAKAEKERADELKQVADFQAEMLAQVDPTTAGVRLTEDVVARFNDGLALARIPEADRPAQLASFRTQWTRVNATDAATQLIDATILTPAVAAIDKQFSKQPIIDARLRQVLADRYRDLGLFDVADPLQQAALEIRRRELGDDHPDTLASLNNAGVLRHHQGRNEEAQAHYRQALDGRRRVLGPEHPLTLETLNSLSVTLIDLRKLEEARRCALDSLEASRRTQGADHPDSLLFANNLALLLLDAGEYAEAERYAREALEGRRRVLGDDDTQTITSLNNLGLILHSQDKVELAEPYYREAMERSRRVQGEEHPDTLTSINNMGSVLRMLDRYDEAEALYREALNKRRIVLGEDHPHTLISIGQMGALYRQQGKYDLAEPYLREAMDKRRRLLGEENVDTLMSVLSVGMVLRLQGKFADAIATIEPVQDAVRREFAGDNAWAVGLMLRFLGESRAGLGRGGAASQFAAAERDLLEAQSLLASTRGESNKDTRDCVQALIDLYTAWHTAEPDKGYDARAAEWKAKLDA